MELRVQALIPVISAVLGFSWTNGALAAPVTGVEVSADAARRAAAVSEIIIEAPPLVNATEGDSLVITAFGGSGDPHSQLEVRVSGEPPGFVLDYGAIWSPSHAVTLSGVLGFETAGTWVISWTIRDQFGAYDSSATQLVVMDNPNPMNLPPQAHIGGPYSGVFGVPLLMDATGSFDPDGDPLTYSWNFGDGLTGVGGVVRHVYVNSGVYSVSVVVSDQQLTDHDEAHVTITNDFIGYAFVTRGDRVLRLDSDKPWFCFGVEPLNGNFQTEDIQVDHFNLFYGNVLISSNGQTSTGEDRNHDGVREVTTCFSKGYLQDLFSHLPTGTHDVAVTLEGWVVEGNRILAPMTLTVVKGGTALSISPNPLRPEGDVAFTTPTPGPARVQVFDSRGRLVRTLLDTMIDAGRHSVRLDGRGRDGKSLASGVYFIRIFSGGQSETVRAVITR